MSEKVNDDEDETETGTEETENGSSIESVATGSEGDGTSEGVENQEPKPEELTEAEKEKLIAEATQEYHDTLEKINIDSKAYDEFVQESQNRARNRIITIKKLNGVPNPEAIDYSGQIDARFPEIQQIKEGLENQAKTFQASIEQLRSEALVKYNEKVAKINGSQAENGSIVKEQDPESNPEESTETEKEPSAREQIQKIFDKVFSELKSVDYTPESWANLWSAISMVDKKDIPVDLQLNNLKTAFDGLIKVKPDTSAESRPEELTDAEKEQKLATAKQVYEYKVNRQNEALEEHIRFAKVKCQSSLGRIPLPGDELRNEFPDVDWEHLSIDDNEALDNEFPKIKEIKDTMKSEIAEAEKNHKDFLEFHLRQYNLTVAEINGNIVDFVSKLDKNDYTPESWNALQRKLSLPEDNEQDKERKSIEIRFAIDGLVIREDEEDDDIDDEAVRIRKSLENNEELSETEQIAEIIEKASELNPDDYTSDSWNYLQKAIDMPDEYEKQVDEKLSRLKFAFEDLEKVESKKSAESNPEESSDGEKEPSASEKIQKILDDVLELKPEDYTTESWGQLQSAIDLVDKYWIDVDIKLNNLKTAFDGLQKLELDKANIETSPDDSLAAQIEKNNAETIEFIVNSEKCKNGVIEFTDPVLGKYYLLKRNNDHVYLSKDGGNKMTLTGHGDYNGYRTILSRKGIITFEAEFKKIENDFDLSAILTSVEKRFEITSKNNEKANINILERANLEDADMKSVIKLCKDTAELYPDENSVKKTSADMIAEAKEELK